MTLRDVTKLLNADVLVCEDDLDVEVKTAFAADLLSDVLAYAKRGDAAGNRHYKSSGDQDR